MADTATELVKRPLDVVQALRCAVPSGGLRTGNSPMEAAMTDTRFDGGGVEVI